GINSAVLAGAVVAWIISKTGGSEEVRAARAEQGTLIASGLMAGAAIFGIISAVLRVPDAGALIQYMSVGVDFGMVDGQLIEHAHKWFEGSTGQGIGLAMYAVLAFACFFLARLGARWQLDADNKSE
ncbi:MAG: hypothetical protein K8R59_03545, partial [Thermoanaerobaculales bacterium]|nr:hypothetical protein [Thermoanaerobaculales bacterium]